MRKGGEWWGQGTSRCCLACGTPSSQACLFCESVAIVLYSEDLNLSSGALDTTRSSALNGNSIMYSPFYLLKKKIGIISLRTAFLTCGWGGGRDTFSPRRTFHTPPGGV